MGFKIARSEKRMFYVEERSCENENVWSLRSRRCQEAVECFEGEVSFGSVWPAGYQVAERTCFASGICETFVVNIKLCRC